MHSSSVAHLSTQFKKITGLTPSHFKQLRDKKTLYAGRYVKPVAVPQGIAVMPFTFRFKSRPNGMVKRRNANSGAG